MSEEPLPQLLLDRSDVLWTTDPVEEVPPGELTDAPIRPLHDWIVVEVIPFDKRSEVLTMIINETNVRKAKVLRVGPKVRDLVPGETVAYIRWHEEHRPAKGTMERLKLHEISDKVAMIRVNDILVVYEGELQVDV